MFKITSGKGFHITFENGYTVSVQWGAGNYCENYDKNTFTEEEQFKTGEEISFTAEIAVWASDKKMIKMPGWDDTVKGWCSPKEVLKLMNWASKQKPK